MDLIEIIEALQRYQERHEADGCSGCVYVDVQPYEHPCRNCKRAKRDLWTSASWITDRTDKKR